MRVTYLLLAHNKPDQFNRLVRALLRDPLASVVAHVDAKAADVPFKSGVGELADRVTFIPQRQDIRWGGFGSVRAVLDAMETAVQKHSADYYIVISGVDYPIRPWAELHEELGSGAVYTGFTRMPDDAQGKPMLRLEYFYIAAKNRHSALMRELNKALLRLPKRNVARGLRGRTPFGGTQWLATPHRVVTEVLRVAAEDRRLMRFMRTTRNPDEMFFQTVIANLPEPPEIRPVLVQMDWGQPGQIGSVADLTSADIPALRDSGKFFARKFDLDADPHVFDRVDAELLAISQQRRRG